MKINTDGVLLGALVDADNPLRILDIGTGTGVIALMLAQRFPNALIDAVEIDEMAAKTAAANFSNSPFADRLRVHAMGFETFFRRNPEVRYDLIVSNPPFYINSLLSPKETKSVAKHADLGFFDKLIAMISNHLSESGSCWLIIPPSTAGLVVELADQKGLYRQKNIMIRSFQDDGPHREILRLGFPNGPVEDGDFTIYSSKDIYSDAYKLLLKPYFLNF